MPYAIGVDYGTQSGRVVLLDLASGREVSGSVIPYKHGVIDRILPTTREQLPSDWALQHPLDYIEVLERGIPEVMRGLKADSGEVIGLGVDFTSCTVLPVGTDGMPLCMTDKWKNRKHAWPKLWKHHAAQPIADRMNNVAKRRGEAFLERYGGKISSEWYFPKLLEVFEQDREIYDASYRFIEATDWIVWYLTGNEYRNSCTAGYKALWSEEDHGLPEDDFFATVNPEFTKPGEKLGNSFYPLGTRAGHLIPKAAEKLGLPSTVAVAVGNVDAMVSAPSVGMEEPGDLVMVMGTSICHLTVTENEVLLPGITGVVKDGVLPGFYGYEAGQAAVGDMFEWFVKHAAPGHYLENAEKQGVSIYEHLEQLATMKHAGESGLIAIDWWNGNRSILSDADLSGVLFGLTLKTTPEDIYRALLESTAFGTRRIVDNFREHGVEIRQLVACGGISQRSPLLMQIYADVCGLPVSVRSSQEIPARGAAMFGAVAAGAAQGGFDTIKEASKRLKAPLHTVYQPSERNYETYTELYEIYKQVHDFFGTRSENLLHQLKDLKTASAQTNLHSGQ